MSDEAVRPREPWLAVVLSSMISGLGQYYCGRPARGLVFFISGSLVFFVGLALVLLPTGSVTVGIAMAGLGGVVYLANLFDAHRLARRLNSAEFEAERARTPDPWRAAYFSSLFLGLGYLTLRGMRLRGIAVVIGLVILGLLLPESTVWSLFWAMTIGVVVWHSYRVAPVHRESTMRPIAWYAALIIITQAAQPLIRAQAQAFRIPSSAMKPTLQPGDLLFVWKSSPRRPHRGEIWVFDFPQDRTKKYTKRVVALPGETVEIRDKALYVDGRMLTEPYVIHSDSSTRPAGFDSRDYFGPVRMPSDQYFVLGDNRDDSNDSRYFGGVERRLLTGRAYKIYWPLRRAGPIR